MYNKVLSIKPDYSAGYNNLASAQNDLGEFAIQLKIMKMRLYMILILMLQKII